MIGCRSDARASLGSIVGSPEDDAGGPQDQAAVQDRRWVAKFGAGDRTASSRAGDVPLDPAEPEDRVLDLDAGVSDIESAGPDCVQSPTDVSVASHVHPDVSTAVDALDRHESLEERDRPSGAGAAIGYLQAGSDVARALMS